MGPFIQTVFGLVVFLAIAYALSSDRRAVRLRPVVAGLALQLVFALIVLKTAAGRALFDGMNGLILKLLSFQNEGGRFLFGPLADVSKSGFIVAFQVLTTIIFFSSLLSVLYHLGLMQLIVRGFAVVMHRTMGVSGAESLSAAANVFVGQTEAPLVVKPYIAGMTRSELLAVMTGGMATVAGGVMALYVGMLEPYFPSIAGHLLAASVMSAPASLVIAKLLVPETEVPATLGKVETAPDESPAANVIEAAALGASSGLTLALNVGTMLVAFLGLVALADAIVGGLAASVFGLENVTLAGLVGYACAPVAFLLGIPTSECPAAGMLVGEKTVLNELIAYSHLSEMLAAQKASGVVVLSERTVLILSYALCGFANILSIGIQIGGIATLAPTRRKDLAELGLRALLAGSLAAFMTGNIAALVMDL